MRRASWVVLLLSFALSVCASLLAQKITGTITGVVTDPQGAVVTGAEVTVKNQGTGATRTATTNAAGVYVVPDLPAGTYEVRVKAPNFKEFISKNVELNVSSTSTVNAALVLGSAGEQVTVEGTAIQVETTNGASGTVVTGQQVRELPLNGNNFIELTQLVPGVSALSSFNVVKKGLEGGVDFSVNGNTVTGNLFLIDGVNNNDIGSNRTILLYPSTQAIDEFKILRNSYGAEYGQAAGAIINIVTRGGTNQWHGGVSYYGRNTVLNAADYFTKRVHSVNPLSAAKDPV
ncbi:MAG TPA: TonB-dependent receptor, partial [Terriglobales bacterium]|nr:TonB-dependent receptor [Terriglobales bacterium]